MIKSLTIQNFQSHAKSDLDFHPGVNIIVGPSDSGKTAIIRSIRWLIWNRPSGDAIRSKWGGKTEVTLETEKGWVIRTKDKLDTYILSNESAEFAFKAFGTQVPEEIIEFLNLNEINLQRQLDNPFLLSDTPGIVAQHFNKVAKLDKIDTSTFNINSAIRELTSDIKYKEEQQDNLTEELKQFEYLQKMEMDIEVLEEEEKRWLSIILNKNDIDKLIRNVQWIDNLIDRDTPLLKLEDSINQIFQWKDRLNEEKKHRKTLWSIISSINLTNSDIAYYDRLITLETLINNLLKLYSEINTTENDKMSLFNAITRINGIGAKLKTAEGLKTKFQAKLDTLEICPFCGTKLN